MSEHIHGNAGSAGNPDPNPAKGISTPSLPTKPTRGDGAGRINVVKGIKK